MFDADALEDYLYNFIIGLEARIEHDALIPERVPDAHPNAVTRLFDRSRLAVRGRAERIELEPDAADAELGPQPRRDDDQLGVDLRFREAERLEAKLMELPVAALLGPFVPEHRAADPQLLLCSAISKPHARKATPHGAKAL